jgi:3-dehydroquinate synthase
MHALTVPLGHRTYPVLIGRSVLGDAEVLAPHIHGRQVLVITNDIVAPLWLKPVRAALADYDLAVHVLPDGEDQKNLETFATLLDVLAGHRFNRDATIVALGGGVVGDLAGFTAACWQRGIGFVQLPTTLLAQVDAAVGGKTAVNIPSGKNLVGAFHQPSAVLADTSTLATLPGRELRAGLAEVLKYGAIIDPAFFDWIERHAAALLARDPERLAEAIERSCRHKAAIVARDETEQGERALLNFGHTFGHAIETATGYGNLLHGEAVAIGMQCAARLSTLTGRADAASSARLQAALAALGLPTEVPAGLDPAALLHLMRLDKKAVSGRLRLILWRGIGAAEIVSDVDDADILSVLAHR